ncbi:MAG: DNA polymerase III subunit gamma/tau, partial [Akkermansia sp.]
TPFVFLLRSFASLFHLFVFFFLLLPLCPLSYNIRVSYQVFARKYRPTRFQDVLGQDHVVQTLCNAIEQKRLAHAYLFVGPRGTGKTSTARIFAKALNCTNGPSVNFDPNEDICQEIADGRSLDVLEIDGASNRGIDNIRDLRDNVQFAPARGQFRIIYIDEVHMLTKESFNALLKTLEEPPAHVKFIFATTEPHKILPTILSRCQRFDLRPIPADIIAKHLVHIAEEEGVSLSPTAAMGIARVADGGMRDAQSMLDQLVSFCGNSIEESNVNEIFGVTSSDTVAQMLCYLLDRQLPSLLHVIHELAEAGRDMGQLLSEIMSSVRELLVSKVAPAQANTMIPAQWKETLEGLLARTPSDKIIRLMEVLADTEERLRWSTNKRLHLEMGLIQAVHSLAEANISDVIRALNGAPIPETPIATELLPPVAYPSSAPVAAASAPVLEPVPAPTPAPATIPPAEPSPSTGEAREINHSQFPIPNSQLEHSDATPAPVVIPEPTPEPIPSTGEAEGEATVIMQDAGLDIIDDDVPSFDSFAAPTPAEAASSFSSVILEPQPMTAALWDDCMAQIARELPLKSMAIQHCLFISDDEGLITIAIHPKDNFAMETLMEEDIADFIRTFGEQRCGKQLRLRLITDDSLPAPAEDEKIIAPEPTPRPAPSAAPKKAAPAPAPDNSAQEQAQKEREEAFYKDPLIELALEKFHARIIQS